MPEHGRKYVRLREVSIVALLAHPTIEDAAKAAGISEKALRLWMAKPDFAESVRTLRKQVLEAGASRLTGLVSKAIETLEEGLSAKETADRTRAARAILEFRERMDKSDLQERVATLEQQLAEMKKGSAATSPVAVHVSVSPDVMTSLLHARRERLARQRERDGVQVIDNALPHTPTNGNGHALP